MAKEYSEREIYHSGGKTNKAGSNVDHRGGVNNGGNPKGCFGGNCCTDPKSSIMEISHGVRIKGKITLGHYDFKGFPVEGPIKIKNLRVYDESKLVGKLQLIALTPNIQDDDWFDKKKALLIEEYIGHQEASRIKRGTGFVYEPSFFKIK